MHQVVSDVDGMRGLVLQNTDFLAKISTLHVIVDVDPDNFLQLLLAFVARAPALTLITLGSFQCCSFHTVSVEFRLALGRLVCQPRHPRLYIHGVNHRSNTLRLLARDLGLFSSRDVMLHGLNHDDSVVDFVQDRYGAEKFTCFLVSCADLLDNNQDVMQLILKNVQHSSGLASDGRPRS
jgi:hypothetical protein